MGAFARVLADHGYAGATIATVAVEAGVAAGLIHHHFDGKQDLLAALLDDLVARFRRRVERFELQEDPLLAYGDGALALDEQADVVAARCWVGVFAEAMRDPTLFRRMRRLIDVEIETIRARSDGRLSAQQAGSMLAYVLGALVLGSFAPRKTSGFAAPGLRHLIEGMQA